MMEQVFWEEEIAQRLIPDILSNAQGHPFIIGVVGVPGIGKVSSIQTTSSRVLQQNLNRILQESYPDLSTPCKIIPMDGFHYYKHELDTFDNPEQMHFRRGAHFTFNPQKLLDKLRSLVQGESVYFPAFEHYKADPEEDVIFIDSNETKAVIIEGLYLYINEPIWTDIRSLISHKIYIDGDQDSALQRLIIRNAQQIGFSIEYSEKRANESDKLNAFTVAESKIYADTIVQFREKPSA